MKLQTLIKQLTVIQDKNPDAEVTIDEGADGPVYDIVDVVVISPKMVGLELGDRS